MRVAVCQVNSREDRDRNLAVAREMLERAAAAGVEVFYVSFLPSDYAAGGGEAASAVNVSRGLGFHPMAARGFFPWVERIDIDRECELFAEQAQLLEAREEAVEVLVEPEELALPDRDDVVGRVRAQEAEVENRHACLGNRHEPAVDVRHACRGVRRHSPMLPM